MRQLHQILWAAMPLISAPLAWGQELTVINFTPEKAPVLTSTAKQVGLTVRVGDRKAKTFNGPLLVWEAKAGGGTDITPEIAEALGEYVRRGGSLLLTLSGNPGTGPFRLASILPTTAWNTQGGQSVNGAKNSGSLTLEQLDTSFYSTGTNPKLTVPFYFSIRPFHAVERGEARYEKFQRNIPYIDLPVTEGHTFWTRPLLNREWTIRARGNDISQSPLLLTGRYGAGRVAVFASSIEGLADSTEAHSFLGPVLSWLTKKEEAAPVATPANLSAPVIAVDVPNRSLKVTIINPTNGPLPLKVLARLSTWENSLVEDLTQNTTIPANGQSTVTLPIPKTSNTNYQAVDYRDAFNARIGVLSMDGSSLLVESHSVVDLRPTVQLAISTDNLRSLAYPFKAPGPEILNFPNRMGLEIDNYAYQPGKSINAQVTINNGTRNLAPLATARDEVRPDNPSIKAINDEAAHGEQTPNTDKIQAYGTWTGLANQENVLSFTFPSPVNVSAVTLVGSPDNFRNYQARNPGAAIIEINGKEVANGTDIDDRFVSELGRVRFSFAPQQAKVVRVRLPWVNKTIKTPQGERRREAPWLGDIRIEGTTEALPPVAKGTVTVGLRDSLTGILIPVGSQDVSINAGAIESLSFSFTPPNTGASPRFYKLEASFAGRTEQSSFMTIQPARPLIPLKDLKPTTAPDMGFIVSRGFRNVFNVGTGTAEIPPASWATPDDLIWAYSHQMKQLGRASRTQAGRLYLSESDMRHYATPWRDFPNGTYFYDIAPSYLVDRMKKDRRWNNSDVVILSHSDRWDSAPDVDALHGWQDFIGFDRYLKSKGHRGLKGRTRQELTKEVHADYENEWQTYHLDRYIKAIGNLRDAFAKEGKRVVITAQGSPLVPANHEKVLTDVIRGQSDDSTWGMVEENVPLSVGRQMGVMAYNPGWAMSTLIQWGWDSAVLSNPHWHQPVGTTEPSRRHLYDRAWRGTLGWDGQYRSIHTYGYNSNGGVSFTMTPNDWQQWWNVQERHSLITPDAPIGAGIIISTARFADPKQTSWSGSGGSGHSKADDQVRTVQRTLRNLQEAGLSIPFAANAGTLENWNADSPLVLLDIGGYSASEIATLAKLKARGVHLVAFKGEGDLSAAAATVFGVNPDGTAAKGTRVANLDGKPIVSGANSLLIAAKADDLTVNAARDLAPLLKKALDIQISFPTGTAGYGFASQGKKFIVVEDWREEGRVIELKLRASAQAKSARAVNVNSHQTLTVRRDGGDWVIQLPIRPGDGVLVAIDEEVTQ
jgi:hypothetical protein